MHKELPPREVLQEILDYDPNSGTLTWRHRPARYFKTEESAARWNTCWSGKTAFTATQHGYCVGCVLSIRTKAHRIIWKMLTGKDAIQIDHINGVRSDNRFENLRDCTPTENQRNRRLNRNNRGGQTGVCFARKNQKWQASIKYQGKQHYLGQFNNIRDAIDLRQIAERLLGYHQNHGTTRTP